MDDVTVIDRQPNVAIDKAVLFSMRNLPLLEQGTFADGSIKEGASAKNGETSKPRIYAKGKYFAPD